MFRSFRALFGSATEKEALALMLRETLHKVVQRIRDGERPEEIARILDINIRTIYRGLERFHYGGKKALHNQPKSGRSPKLNSAQLQWIAMQVRDKNPMQLNFPFALWTLGMIRELIRPQFNIRLSEVSVGRIMRTLGFSPQRPVKRAYEQNPVLVEEWRTKDFPKIRRRSKKEGAQIFFADEAGIRSDYHRGRTWSPVGETPVVERAGARFSVNMLSAVSPRGELRFMVHEETATAGTFCEFLKRLAQGIESKIFLIVDGHRIHRAKKVQALLEQLDGKITLFFLPPYSPQLNPDEWVWNNVKQRISKQPVSAKAEPKAREISALRSLQQMPGKIRGFFGDPDCAYAAEG